MKTARVRRRCWSLTKSGRSGRSTRASSTSSNAARERAAKRTSYQAAAAISVIHNVPGSHAQFLLTLGSGEDKIVQMIQCDLSPAELWTFTTNPDERNARARVQSLNPDWSPAEVIAWLSLHYLQGLTGAGLIRIDESLLDSNQFTGDIGNE